MSTRERSKSREARRGADLAIHERIRNRRQERALAGYELARRVGISPSYISLIERGSKVPSEEIAVRIARVLDDDAELYRAWARSCRVGNLEDTLSGVVRLMEISSNPRLRSRFSSGDDMETLGEHTRGPDGEMKPGVRARLQRWLPRRGGGTVPEADVERLDIAHPSSLAEDARTADTELRIEDIADALAAPAPDLVEVPVLAEGDDPDPVLSEGGDVGDSLSLDRRTLPADATGGLFAYRIVEGGFTGLRGQLGPGDLVVLARDPGKLSAERVYAVRRDDGIVLSRVLRKGDSLLLLPAEGRVEFDVLELGGRGGLSALLAGRVVLTVKRW